MEKIVIKYKGYKAEIVQIPSPCSNYDMMLHILKGKQLISGVSIKACTPINEITNEIERGISKE